MKNINLKKIIWIVILILLYGLTYPQCANTCMGCWNNELLWHRILFIIPITVTIIYLIFGGGKEDDKNNNRQDL